MVGCLTLLFGSNAERLGCFGARAPCFLSLLPCLDQCLRAYHSCLPLPCYLQDLSTPAVRRRRAARARGSARTSRRRATCAARAWTPPGAPTGCGPGPAGRAPCSPAGWRPPPPSPPPSGPARGSTPWVRLNAGAARRTLLCAAQCRGCPAHSPVRGTARHRRSHAACLRV